MYPKNRNNLGNVVAPGEIKPSSSVWWPDCPEALPPSPTTPGFQLAGLGGLNANTLLIAGILIVGLFLTNR